MEVKKRVYIIHGWSGSPEEPHLKWLAEELLKLGFQVFNPHMPDTDSPKIETWVPFLQKLVGVPDKNTFFVGHSIGCQTILRYFETLSEDVEIGGAVFVAGWYNVRNIETEEDKAIVEPWVKTPRNDEKIKRLLKRGMVFLSDNDPFVAPENAQAWREKAGVEVIMAPHKGHFNEEAGVKKLPEVLNALLEIVSQVG